jgi:hypothetical protein
MPERAPLSDAEVQTIAAAIARAVSHPPLGDPRDDILSLRHELPPADEDRVIAALEALQERAAAPPGRRIAQPHDGRHPDDRPRATVGRDAKGQRRSNASHGYPTKVPSRLMAG